MTIDRRYIQADEEARRERATHVPLWLRLINSRAWDWIERVLVVIFFLTIAYCFGEPFK